jgi:exonuclease SbcC
LNELKKIIEKLEKVPQELEALEKEKAVAQKRQATQEQIIRSSRENIESILKRIEFHRSDLKRHEVNLKQTELLTLLEGWIQQVFLPSIQSIEKSVLISINQEFNRLFKRWFSNLIESEELQGYIDEEFTPIVDQGGYELEVESLSGGEKTSVALAYRLALNTIVKQVTDTMKNNLLILDEPTDGFSKDQLFKLRDILNELGCDQVILVSHEAELESVADSIYKVTKEGNISTVIHP